MKKLVFSFIIICFFSCSSTYENISVSNYIKQLENGTYDSYELPFFSKNDIPLLIEHIHKKSMIAKHPTNPISSFHSDSVTLGVMAMWTIESIRLSEINKHATSIDRYPSLNPRLVDTTYVIKDKTELQYIALTCYNKWWNNRLKSTSQKMNENPLKNTNVRWR